MFRCLFVLIVCSQEDLLTIMSNIQFSFHSNSQLLQENMISKMKRIIIYFSSFMS